MKIDRNIIADYLEGQINKRIEYEEMPENENGYSFVSRENILRVVDGLIPLIKSELNKNKPKINNNPDR
jgi:hypothetical protein